MNRDTSTRSALIFVFCGMMTYVALRFEVAAAARIITIAVLAIVLLLVLNHREA